MIESSSPPGADDEVMVQFLGDLERRGSVVIDDYKRRYPSLAPEFDGAVRMQDVLGDARHDPLEVPERLGEFRLVRRLSTGGMGELYEAEQERVGRRVVVKIIRRGRISPQSRDRFLREQEVLAKLHQTNIVPIYAAGEEGRLQFYAMPYIDGAALDHVVRAAWDAKTAQPGSKTPTLVELAGKLARPKGEADKPPLAPVLRGEGPGVRGFSLENFRPLTPGPSPPKRGRGEYLPASESSTPTAAEATPAAESTSTRLTLSPEYFRSVAQALADVAEAVHHAHGAGILHRDLKPSNMMVDRSGHCWVIDFGLAGYLAIGGDEPGQVHATDGSDPAAASGVMGTPNYMAPEQFDSKADARSDVWALGATLYELLTLRRAFAGDSFAQVRTNVLEVKRLRIEELTANVPADLAAVCRKAMRKEPQARYATAQEFADDLRRWLRHEPTKARGAWTGRRMWLWGRRNPGWATAIVAVVLAIVGATAGGAEVQRERAEYALETARAEGISEERKQEAERQSLIRQAEGIRLKSRSQGWRDDAWALQGKAAKIRTDDLLRGQAAATLAGIDARTKKEFETFDAPWLTFDPKGERLLISGAPASGSRRASGAKVWNLKKDELTESLKPAEAGPIAFRPDGAPVQLVPGEKLSLQLWDVTRGTKIKDFQFSEQVRKQEGTTLARGGAGLPVLAMSRDGSLVAASVVDGKAGGLTVVWDGSGKQLLEVAQPATAVSFAPSGTLFATGDREGDVAVWSLPQGKPAGRFRASPLPVFALAFSQDAGVAGGGQIKGRLTVGGAGGGLIIWDLQENLTRAICRGSYWDVYAVAHSPDGMLVASAGRDAVHLWDAATGALLLSCPGPDHAPALVFSPDGNLLAAGSRTVFARGGVIVRRLEDGRGVRTLRGLSQPVIHVSLSQDGRRLAALAHNWEVAVWDLPQGRLRNTFQTPRGITPDNAGLVLSRDGRRVAFATTGGARLWDVESGKELGKWGLKSGIVDRLAFDDKDRLLLFRAEKEGDRQVCRLRNLLGAEPLKPIAEMPDFDMGVLAAVLTPDGSSVVVAGLSGPDKERWLRAYKTATGKELWHQNMLDKLGYSLLVTDPAGRILSVTRREHLLAEVATGKEVDVMPHAPYGLSPGARYTIAPERDEASGAIRLTLYRRKDRAALVSFAIDVARSSHNVQFDSDGTRVVWGNADGTVSVAHLAEVQRQLAELGLGWE